MSEKSGPRNEKRRQMDELQNAGWELVERGSGKTIWRNPQSGRLYPQYVAISMVRDEPSPQITDDGPGDKP